MFGLDEPSKYRNVYDEQYFTTDYHETFLDGQGYAIDTSTQLSVNDAPVGVLGKRVLCVINYPLY